ncbi:MAG: radical SAM protein [Chitinispirillales bacterium]|jgi:hypothetical protein|nr:radical SAM protein [Chitinispirillales bacterium]
MSETVEKSRLLSEYGCKKPTLKKLLKKIPMLMRLVTGLRKVKTKIKTGISKTVKPKREKLFFDVHICDHCNLNCKSCTNFCPLAEKKFVDSDILERDFKRLSELTNRRCDVSLIGGEPLLHPGLIKILDITGKYFDCGAQLVTNGILLAEQPDEFWQSCRKNAVKLVVSVYPIKIDEDKIIAQARKHGVELEALDRTGALSWYKHTWDLSGGRNVEKAYRKCPWGNVCIYLEDGKLDPCGFPLLTKHFNKYFDKSEYGFAEPSEDDYVDIFKVNSIDEILEKLANPIPYCRYCTLNFSYSGWERSGRGIEEWVKK